MKNYLIPLIIVLLLIAGIIGFSAYWVSFQYERDIGSHIENAYEVNTPERMIAELEFAKQGMREADLKEGDYGALFFKKPDNSMAWQYDFIDSIVERAKAVQEWQDKVESDGKAVESLGDVYENKMDNLRGFLKEGDRADWIAKDAWYVKNHLWFYLKIPFIIMVLLIIVVVGVFGICVQ